MKHESKTVIATASLALVLVGACSRDDGAQRGTANAARPATATAPSVTTAAVAHATTALNAVVRETMDKDRSIPGLLLHLEASNHGVDVSVAGGLDDRATGMPLAPDAGVRIGSNTKTFVAAAVLRLAEQGALGLDDPIGGRLAPETVQALRGGGYHPDAITVRQLLLHTSGVYDYGQDPAYQAAVETDPSRRWTRLQQVQWAMDHGDPTGAPGERYAYSDTGYILLGEIIERSSGRPLPEAVRTLLDFDGIGLHDTYWEALEPVPPGVAGRAHQYIGDFDGYGMDPSFDLYGAAGLVSTVGDLSAFYRALLRGEVFARAETLATMLEIPASNDAEHAGMGIFRHDLEGVTCWGHTGFWGTVVLTCPDIDVTVAASILQQIPGSGYEDDEVLVRALHVGTGG